MHCSNGACVCDDGYRDPDGDGDCACGPPDVDAAASASLLAIPKEPWEQGEAYSCSANAVLAGCRVSSESKYDNKGAMDVCRLNIPVGSLASGHSHPHFKYPRDRGVRCRGYRLMDPVDVRDQNNSNKNFSPADRESARNAGVPLYLVVPERNRVKVYRP